MNSRELLTKSARLSMLARGVGDARRVADIGTDHGRLPVLLVRDYGVERCIATERTADRLAVARRRVERAGLQGAIELRHGDGLAPLCEDDRVDAIVLAGMGGRTIRRILGQLSKGSRGVRRVVLQPRTEPGDVRRCLDGIGMAIVDEDLREIHGRWYPTIVAEAQDRARPTVIPDGLELDDVNEIGPVLLRQASEEVVRFWKRELRRCARVVRALPSNTGRVAAHRDHASAARRVAYLERCRTDR